MSEASILEFPGPPEASLSPRSRASRGETGAFETDGERGVVFDIQHYALYDGPGIRSAIYLKGCPLSCFWCHNPESQSRKPELAFYGEKCASSGACVAACPSKALHLTPAGPVRDPDSCRTCGTCVQVCGSGARELFGDSREVDSVVRSALADRAFFESSGGGVTVTGGEPTWQHGFLLTLLKRLKQERVHTALETCGSFPARLVDDLADLVDLFLFDLKLIDPVAHRRGTGADNQQILANFEALLGRVGSERITPRVPVIPGFNADRTALAAIGEFLKRAGYEGAVHLMPHHGWARTKYESLGRGEDYRKLEDLSAEDLASLAGVLDATGYETVLYG